MKPITFENLRRLMGGGRKKKDRAESSFKRSDSFKRISIRKNYLDRGGKGRNPLSAASRAQAAEKKNSAVPPISENSATETPGAEPVVIGYGQWIKCMKAEDYGSSGSKERARSPSRERKPPTPPPRKKYSAPSADSSLEILKLEKSPIFVRRRFRKSPPPSSKVLDPKTEDRERSDSALSVSLGRVWMDAPLAMANAPRSLELPRPSSSSVDAEVSARRAHHSLESALKDRRDDKPQCSRRFHNYPSRPLSPTPFIMPNPSAICRTLSSTTQTTSTSKTISSRGSTELLSTSKDSGFSFSISIPRLTDFGSPSSGGGGFFRKKKPNKPKPSVSRDGYFKRTSGAYKQVDSPRRGSIRRSSSRKLNSRTGIGAARKKSYGGTARSDMYQVVVSRPPRSLKSLKLDPMIFVPPEKRKPTNSVRRPVRLEVQEIRDYCSPRDMKVAEDNGYDEDEGLYECISGELSEGDSEEGAAAARRQIQFSNLSDNDADTEDETYAPLGVSPVPERRPVRRRKSARKNVKYLVKPTIHRAPSTLKKNRKAVKKTGAICKTKWSNLRNSYARYIRDLKKMPSGSAKKKKKWHLAEAMDFLQPWTGSCRKISSSLSSSETQDSAVPSASASNEDQAVTHAPTAQPSFAQTPTESATGSDVSAGSVGGEYVPKKMYKKTPSGMVAAPMIDFLKVATESRKLDANKTTENAMLSYFKGLLPDTDILTDGRKRRFKMQVMEVLHKLIEEQENEHLFSRPTSTSSSSYDHTPQLQGTLFPGGHTLAPFSHSNEGPQIQGNFFSGEQTLTPVNQINEHNELMNANNGKSYLNLN